MKTIGITTTIPIEILLAKGYRVIDLNNIFITSKDYLKYIDIAEKNGFPKSSCAWIKGIYGVCMEKNIEEIVGVVEGDCSNTKSLIEVLKTQGIKVYPFSYPHSHTLQGVKNSIDQFASIFNVDLEEVENMRIELKTIRSLATEIDRLTYEENKATGLENHIYQISCSDFNGDVYKFKLLLQNKIKEIERRKRNVKKLRLGFIGVPPMFSDIYEFVEKFDAHFVYNEVQREFTFPRGEKHRNIYEQYYDYTYPYDIGYRLKEINNQIRERSIDGIIHYTQTFCHRAIEDIIVKKLLKVPVLNIEGDKLNTLDARTKLRIEAFLDMLSDLKGVHYEDIRY